MATDTEKLRDELTVVFENLDQTLGVMVTSLTTINQHLERMDARQERMELQGQRIEAALMAIQKHSH